MSKSFEMPEIPSEFIVRLKHAGNKEFIKAEGLIYLGHLQGLKRIDVQVVQFPTADNPGTCYARCEVETSKGIFTDYGEVTPDNKGQVGGNYPVSIACTRARNRALRQATNCPLTSYEEMGMQSDRDDADGGRAPTGRAQASRPQQQTRQTPPLADAHEPAPATWVTELLDLATELYDLTDETIDIGMAPTKAQAHALKAKIEGKLAVAKGGAAPATKEQITKLNNLNAKLGKPTVTADAITAEEAARQIAEAVQILNKQIAEKQAAKGAPSRANAGVP